MDSDKGRPRRSRLSIGAVALALLAIPATGCQTAPTGSSIRGRVVTVVAAEDFWGSVAAQVGGTHAAVTSIIRSPDVDPHSYEPTPADAREVATAGLVIENGIGYDPWLGSLLAADRGRRTVLNVGRVVGVTDGGNPHRWYNPGDVQRVIGVYVDDLSALDPADAAYFQGQARQFQTVGLAAYHGLISRIRDRYDGTPVGASESIFSMLAPSLGLQVVTPYSFLRAISEGSEVGASDKARIDRQIKDHLIRIYVYNRQNTTPDVQAQLAECRAAGIPTTPITETLVPPTSSYQDWQVRQLQGILDSLQEATAR